MLHIPKNFGVQICDEVYDPNGKKYKEFLKVQKVVNHNCLTQAYLEVIDFRTNHLTVITFKNMELNSGINEKVLTVKGLMRTKW